MTLGELVSYLYMAGSLAFFFGTLIAHLHQKGIL